MYSATHSTVQGLLCTVFHAVVDSFWPICSSSWITWLIRIRRCITSWPFILCLSPSYIGRSAWPASAAKAYLCMVFCLASVVSRSLLGVFLQSCNHAVCRCETGRACEGTEHYINLVRSAVLPNRVSAYNAFFQAQRLLKLGQNKVTAESLW